MSKRLSHGAVIAAVITTVLALLKSSFGSWAGLGKALLSLESFMSSNYVVPMVLAALVLMTVVERLREIAVLAAIAEQPTVTKEQSAYADTVPNWSLRYRQAYMGVCVVATLLSVGAFIETQDASAGATAIHVLTAFVGLGILHTNFGRWLALPPLSDELLAEMGACHDVLAGHYETSLWDTDGHYSLDDCSNLLMAVCYRKSRPVELVPAVAS